MEPGPNNFLAQFTQAVTQAPEAAPAAPVAPQAAEAPQAAAASPSEVGQTPTPEVNLEARFAKLNAASAKVQEERRAFAAEREAMKKDLAELQQLREARARAKEDPVGWAQLGGYEQPDIFATTLMDKGALTPERKKILELEKQTREQAERWQSFEAQQREAAQKQQEAAALAEVRHFGTQPEVAEQFDLVNRFNAHHLVLQEISAHWNQTLESMGEGEILDLAEAYARVEDRLDKEIAPALESPKYRSRFGAAAPAARPTGAPASTPAPRQQGTTITGQMRAQSSPPRQQTEQERLAEAYNLFFAGRG